MSRHPIDVPDLPGGTEWLSAWTFDPWVLGALGVASIAYTAGSIRLWRHASVIRPGSAVAHGAGLAILAIALVSPLDRASDVAFSAHMAQHELLMLVAAPLIVIGRPLAPVLWALPRRWRVAMTRSARTPLLSRTWRVLTLPVVALLLHAAARWVWHVPGAFDAALADERIHAFQHVTFFATAMLFWWTLLHGRYGRLGYGVGLAFTFFTMLHSGLLAALLGFAETPLYAHGERSARAGIDAIGDQQLAGFVMWVPAGIAMTAIGLAVLAAWLGESRRRISYTQFAGDDRR